MSNSPSFDEFYQELTGYDPFPWQSRLASLVNDTSTWPSNIGVPTGLGKTSTLTIAVWAMAIDAERTPKDRQCQRRIWYVVNRRLLVDAALEHAEKMQQELREPGDKLATSAVAERLQSLQVVQWDCGPLHVARLRGGAERGLRPPDPGCPSLIVSTVPMFGSRILFRGYGSSSGMRSIDAAHSGTDSLVLLDEAHLAQPLQKVLGQRDELRPPDVEVLTGPRSLTTLVNLTATGSSIEGSFDLEDEDRAHGVVKTRLAAKKPTTLVSCKDKQATARLAAEAMRLSALVRENGHVPATVIFVNTARRAPDVKKALDKLIKKELRGDAEVLVLTGRLRPHDAAVVRDRLLVADGNVKSGNVSTRSKPLFVIATQTLEVGADVDFDALVSETAGVRSVTQRFGRLNRLGLRPWAQASLVHSSDKKEWPPYGPEAGVVWNRLKQVKLDIDLDLSPAAIAGILGEPEDSPPSSPELLPNHVWEWAKTSLIRADETDIDPFISGQEEHRTVTVIWRDALPLDVSSCEPPLLLPVLHQDEAVDIPLYEIRDFLEESEPDSASHQAFLVGADGATLTRFSSQELHPGRTVVLATESGGYSAVTGWDATNGERVDDLSTKLRQEFVLTSDAIFRFFDAVAADEAERDEIVSIAGQSQQSQLNWSGSTWIPDANVIDLEDQWSHKELTDRLGTLARTLLGDTTLGTDRWRLRRSRSGPAVIEIPTKAGASKPAPKIETIEGLSLSDSFLDSNGLHLSIHCNQVGELAAKLADAVGLSPGLTQSVALAGRLHDVGKADPRFQAMLGADHSELLAKSRPESTGSRVLWPRGARHEMVSGFLIDEWISAAPFNDLEVDFELARHLVLSHHGHGRPLVPPVNSGGVVTTRMIVEGTEVKIASDLAQTDWTQPSRFQMLCGRYGYWGLALLETVLRQADHAVSAQLTQQAHSSKGLTPQEVI